MPNIAVTPEQLHSTGSQLNAGAANIESILSQLASQVAPLQSEWQGILPQARFQELWAEWQRSSRGIQEALHGISQLTQQAVHLNYADTEQGIASASAARPAGSSRPRRRPAAPSGALEPLVDELRQVVVQEGLQHVDLGDPLLGRAVRRVLDRLAQLVDEARRRRPGTGRRARAPRAATTDEPSCSETSRR